MSFHKSVEQGTTAEADKSIPLLPLHESALQSWLENATDMQKKWVRASGFQAKPGEYLAIPDSEGNIESALFGMQEEGWLYQLAALYNQLPDGRYVLQSDWSDAQSFQASVGWGLAAYRFDRYRSAPQINRSLELSEAQFDAVTTLCSAQNLVRDLVNTPAEHMGPAQLSNAVSIEAEETSAEVNVISGDALLDSNFPSIHAVGRASDSEPRLVEMNWGSKTDPLLVLVGKGVCFDTGGLNIKNGAGMVLMKKDMGGAAHTIALAKLIMKHALPVRLKLLIPAVENSISGNAYRPSDVIPTRQGLSVEIGNTDAEGRVVLSDALTYACESNPDLIIDFATLTGAARIALGADLPALFSNRPEVASGIQQAGEAVEDPLWTMPLYQPYKKLIQGQIADITNSAKSSYGGCITAALFLEHFVTKHTDWVHIDTFAWNNESRIGRPAGGEALGLRAVFHYLESRYG